MAEAVLGQQAGAGKSGVIDSSISMLMRGDLSLAIGLMAIIAVLLFPMPPFLLDVALGI